tara:strand:- start:186 stop:452 length:267 start_codon:yes stop_codon:yes gene_type:complete
VGVFLSWFFLFFFQNLWFNIPMMNDMMPTIEETIDMNDIAQHEHEQWLRECEREERWEALEAIHGPFLKPDEAALVRRTAAHVAKVTG